MDHRTPYFPQLRAQCAPLGAQLKRAGAATESLAGLAALFTGCFAGLLVPAKTGAGSRQRELPRVAVFWAFLGQVFLRGASCRWALTRLQADAVAKGHQPMGESTSAYCQARVALPLLWLQSLFAALARWFDRRSHGQWFGRTVRLVDGTGFSMPDTEENRRRWPYAGGQKRGCGFPTGKLVGLFCLHTGRLLAFAESSWKDHDLSLARRLLRCLRAGEVLVADRAYCGWFFLAQLLARKVDFVIRLHQARTVRSRRYRSWWEAWKKPQRPKGQSRRSWKKRPEELLLRLVRFQVQARGFRTQSVIVVTSLLDEKAFPDSAIAELYARRWQVELHYRQIKTNLSLDVLRGRTPNMIERELWMHAIAYNLVRALLWETSLTHDIPVERLSFKGALDALQAWGDRALRTRRHRRLARRTLLARVAADRVPLRAGRSEPRARKRRQKDYQLLNRPRHLMRVSNSRRLR
ncbi:MAG: IS4 family transposase [Phaeospirillum sp.]|nr:IS4 family transposase [Phaeospirillum sp.]